MTKIKLSQLKMYLDTKLICEITDIGVKKKAELCGVYSDGTAAFWDTIEGDKSLESIRPQVRPLSMLTEEITVGGTFVPIVELSKMISQASFSEKYIENWIYNKEQSVATLVYQGVKHPNCDLVRNNFFDIDTDTVNFSIGSFDSKNNTEFFDSGCQLQMFQKLFDWHFDVFGWIDNNLADAIK